MRETMAEDRKYTHRYIPREITRAWSEDGKAVGYLSKGDGTVHTAAVEDMFTEDIILDCPEDELESWMTFSDVLSFIEDAGKGICHDTIETRLLASQLVFFMYQCVPDGDGIADYCARIKGVRDSTGTSAVFRSLLKDFRKKKRTASLLEDLAKFKEFNCMYVLDLECVILSAPDTVEFVLGDNPLHLGNLVNPDTLEFTDSRFQSWGTFFILPLTPHRALCLYDSYSYKVRQKDGTVEVNEEDVRALNSCIFRRSSTVVVTDGTTDIPDSLSPDGNPSFSFLGVRARAFETEMRIRDFDYDFMQYDAVVLKNPDSSFFDGEGFLKRFQKVCTMLGVDEDS